MSDSKISVDALIALVRADAEEKRMNAGYSGAMHDGGAGTMLTQIDYYLMGRSGVIPPEWKKYADKLDPEYQEYIRLQKKFSQ